jgi:anti-anti-sigma regulatory factor
MLADISRGLMVTLTEATGGKRQITLPAYLDHTVIHDLRAALLDCLSRGQDIDVNASEVSRLSTPAMQVLASAACAHRDASSGAMQLIAPSPAFRDFAAMLALGDVFGLAEIAA